MQKTHLVSTRKEGVRVMVKVSDPNVFEILDSIGLLLKKQIIETGKLVKELRPFSLSQFLLWQAYSLPSAPVRFSLCLLAFDKGEEDLDRQLPFFIQPPRPIYWLLSILGA